MPKSSEPTVPLYDSSGNFIGELATNSSRIAVKDKSGDEVRHNGTEFRIDAGVDTPSVSTDVLGISGSDLYKSGEYVTQDNLQPNETSDQTTTNTTYTTALSRTGWVDLGNIPAAATAYIRYVTRLKNDTSSETTSSQLRAWDSGVNNTELTETEVSVTATSSTIADSGWVELTSIASDDVYNIDYRLKVSGGTGTIEPDWTGTLVGWQL